MSVSIILNSEEVPWILVILKYAVARILCFARHSKMKAEETSQSGGWTSRRLGVDVILKGLHFPKTINKCQTQTDLTVPIGRLADN